MTTTPPKMRLETEITKLSFCDDCSSNCGSSNALIISVYGCIPKEIRALIDLAKMFGMEDKLPVAVRGIDTSKEEVVMGKSMIPMYIFRELMSQLADIEEKANRENIPMTFEDKPFECSKSNSDFDDSIFGNITKAS